MRLRSRWLDSAGYILVIFQYKGKVAEWLCHFSVKLPSYSNYITISGGISKFLFQIYEVLSEVVNVNFYVCIWQHICNYCWFITAYYSINTKRPNLIANWSQTDSILLPLYCPLEITKLIWRQRPSSKHSFHRQETGGSLHTLTVILVILWS